jgi:hypothetical protein
MESIKWSNDTTTPFCKVGCCPPLFFCLASGFSLVFIFIRLIVEGGEASARPIGESLPRGSLSLAISRGRGGKVIGNVSELLALEGSIFERIMMGDIAPINIGGCDLPLAREEVN